MQMSCSDVTSSTVGFVDLSFLILFPSLSIIFLERSQTFQTVWLTV